MFIGCMSKNIYKQTLASNEWNGTQVFNKEKVSIARHWLCIIYNIYIYIIYVYYTYVCVGENNLKTKKKYRLQYDE